MKKRIAAVIFAGIMAAGMIAGCGSAQTETDTASASAASSAAAVSSSQTAAASSSAEEVDDQAMADNVTALIEAIQVQTWTEGNEDRCAEAKAAWDALTDAQKELVDDPDYFGLDTGDASLDDPRNQDEIGANELLVVSFGTSFNGSRVEDIKAIEDKLAESYPDWSVRRAFTAQIIINHILARDGESIDNVQQALERAAANKVENLVVQPTHLMHGAEYDELTDALEKYKDQFKSVVVAEPLLGEVGSDATVINADKEAAAKAAVAEAVSVAGAESIEALAEEGTALVFMGHGTSHTASVTYSQMQTQMNELGYSNVFIGTVEGEPEETACEAIIEAVKAAGYKNVILRPLMVVAGDHANNDMAGPDDDSWISMFTADGSFENITCQIEGLGRIADIEAMYVAHTQAAIDSLGSAAGTAAASETAAALEDGNYIAEFSTDSSMFHVNEAKEGKGELTVKDGQMTIHISLVSDKILNLYPGTAKEAEADEAGWLQPTTDTVTYSDGISEEVYGFDVPVPVIGEEFDLAIIGIKGVWYDHKVSVTNPVAAE